MPPASASCSRRPIIGAAALLKLPELFGSDGNGVRGPALVGALCAAVTTYFAVKFLLRYFQTNRLTPFGIYCIGAGRGLHAHLRASAAGSRVGSRRRQARRRCVRRPGLKPGEHEARERDDERRDAVLDVVVRPRRSVADTCPGKNDGSECAGSRSRSTATTSSSTPSSTAGSTSLREMELHAGRS